MANLVVLTDTSMTFTDNQLALRLSPLSTNRLEFNENDELSLKDVESNGYLPLNGLVGEVDVPMEQIACDSSVTRLASYNDTNGDVKGKGNTGSQEHDGVNIIGLFTALGVAVNVHFWDSSSYANSVTPAREGWS